MKEVDVHPKKIALIGGAGFIGHNLALALHAAGHSVHVLDSLDVNNFLEFAANSNRDPARDFYWNILKERLDLINGNSIGFSVEDARDYHRLSNALGDIKPDVIVLLAAVSHANKSNKNPYSTFDHSLRTLENALDYARNGGVKHFIYFSSSMVYGNFDGDAVTEDTICNPIGIYGSLKFAGEKIVQAYSQVFDLPCTIVRPSALYGERCVSRRVGQVFLENALSGKDLVIQGDGMESLDFTYIGDLVHGIECVLKHPESRNEIFNLTYGDGRPIKDLVEIVRSEFPSIKVSYVPKDKLMPERGTLSTAKARRLIQYSPQYSLEKGYVRYIRWYRDFWNRSHPKSNPSRARTDHHASGQVSLG